MKQRENEKRKSDGGGGKWMKQLKQSKHLFWMLLLPWINYLTFFMVCSQFIFECKIQIEFRHEKSVRHLRNGNGSIFIFLFSLVLLGGRLCLPPWFLQFTDEINIRFQLENRVGVYGIKYGDEECCTVFSRRRNNKRIWTGS